jgi:hypothetical protein
MAGMSQVIALVDLDDTLFQTRRKCPLGLGDEALTPLGFARDGSALSFATPQQMSFLRWLSETTHLVPVTARSLDALRRVRLDHRAAICAHGGVILDEAGVPDRDWQDRMAKAAERHAPALHALTAAIDEEAKQTREPIAVRILAEGDLPLYVLAKHAEANAEALHAVVDAAVPALAAGWTHHRNGNNVALLPPHLGKANAVAHLLPGLRRRFPDAAVIGIGDSRTDAPFMALCDFAMLPASSQLAERLFDAG